jgi:hypothetical protein
VALTCLMHMGRIRELARRVAHALEDAERRGDLYASTQLRTVLRPNVCLMHGRPGDARAELAIAGAQLATRGIHMQHWQHMQATALLALYEGEGAAALAHLDERWAAMRGAFLFRIQAVRVFSMIVRGNAALAAGESARADADRRRLHREAPDWPAAALLGGQIALLDGDRDRAERELRAAADGYAAIDTMVLSAAARVRWGELVGGDAGRDAVAAAHAALRAEGVADPARVIAMYAPVQVR